MDSVVDVLIGLIGGALMIAVIAIVIGNSQADALRADFCTLAFSHAETRLDSLEVTVKYDYCEVEP